MNEFFSWAMLAGYAGATMATALITQLIKEMGALKRFPTRALSYFVAVIVLVSATVFTGELSWANGVLCFVNAAIVSLAGNGAFDAIAAK
ncbi:hypothetical protein LJC42_06345 [Eubacteriales bacterium OttesenSCG-928-K08]|nr:hypothetical protein [Eubacteriales bacterium OttesenSCG-928-K08]